MEILSCYKQLISEAGFSMSVAEQNNQTSKKIVVTHHFKLETKKKTNLLDHSYQFLTFSFQYCALI